VSVTTLACPACGRLDYPHICKPLLHDCRHPYVRDGELPQERVVADLEQGRVTFEVQWSFDAPPPDSEKAASA
jgi:hypothetical protein